MNADFEVYALRHGQSEANAASIIQGQTSTPLSDFGRRQAASVAPRLSRLPFAASYASDLQRAMETARIALPDLEPIPCPELREWHLGVFQGLTHAQAKERYPDEWDAFLRACPDFRIPGGGESTNDVHERARRFLERLAASHDSGNILVVSHCGLLRAMLRTMLGMAAPWPRQPQLDNAGLCHFRFQKGQWQLLSWNETSHLDQLLAPTRGF